MAVQEKRLKIVLIVILVLGILSLHYFTLHQKIVYHAVYRMLFYLPLVLGSFWFGLRGSIFVSIAVALLYLPYVISRWQGIAYDFNKILEGILFVFIAIVLGYLVEKEKQKHKELIRSKSLAAMGRALSEVAHDMKTPLIAIGGFAQQVYKKLEPDDSNRNKLDVVIHETARLESMVKEMLDFGRPMEMMRSKIDLNQLVLDTTEIADVMARQSNVKLCVDLEPCLPTLSLDSSRIRQVLLNLIANAVHASPSEGEVMISTKCSKEKVIIDVIDHGCGIPEQARRGEPASAWLS
jgi:two-component system sensor histidine kinase HydH